MKKLQSIITLLFVAFAMIAGAAPVIAQSNPGIQPDKGSLTIHKHWATDASQIEDEGNGTENTSITNPPVEHVKFNVYKLTPKPADDGRGTQDAPAIPPSRRVPDNATYKKLSDTELEVKKGNDTYIYEMTLETADGSTGKTDEDGILKYSELDKGFYFVEEDLSASVTPHPTIPGNPNPEEVDITIPAESFVISVPMTNPAGDGWTTDVHVYPKNQGTDADKEVGSIDDDDKNIFEGDTENSVYVGKVFPFMIRTNIPSDIDAWAEGSTTVKKYTKFEIWDKLDEALDYVDGSTQVYVYKRNDLDPSKWEKVELQNNNPGQYFETNYDVGTKTLSVKFTEAGREQLGKALEDENSDFTHVGIEFRTKANEAIFDNADYTVKNTGTIIFNNDGGTDKEITTDETETNTGAIDIDKQDSKGDELKGAEFQIALNDADAKAGNYIKVLLTSDDSAIQELIFPEDSRYATATEWIVRPHETEAGRLGFVAADPSNLETKDTFYATLFEGLHTHTGKAPNKVYNSYWIVETLAPEGFNLLGAPEKVSFSDEDALHVVSEEIVNSKGFQLPNTGSFGAILLTIAGILLLGFAYLMNRKQRQA